MNKITLLEVHASFVSSSLEHMTMLTSVHEEIVRRELAHDLAHEMMKHLPIHRQSHLFGGSIEYTTNTILISREELDKLVAAEVKQELENLAKEYTV